MWDDLAGDDDLDDADLLGVNLDIASDAVHNGKGSGANQVISGTTNPKDKKANNKPANRDKDTAFDVSDFFRLSGNERRRRRREAGETPLDVFRRGYLWVSDFSKQAWCEQQMEYSYTMPVVLVENPIMTSGTSFHLERELAVPDVASVPVSVTSSEDIWAIKVVNLLEAVNSLSTGAPVRREIPIFGSPFGEGAFVVGLIDEIRVDQETFNFEILELKTRKSKSLPSKAQRLTSDLQVMLYKKLFDDLVRGKIDKELIAKSLRLQLDQEFGEDIRAMTSALPKAPRNLDGLLSHLFERMQALPFISQCLVEYCHQDDKSTIAIMSVDYDEVWLERKVRHYLQYWQNGRAVEGVDIEDAWKCERCDFGEVCEWRKQKAEECMRKNIARNQKK